jgi:hypothetical protein
VVSIHSETKGRERTGFTEAWEKAVIGCTAQDLPAYRFQPPCDALLSGLLPTLRHWPWQEPPAHLATAAVAVPPLSTVEVEDE